MEEYYIHNDKNCTLRRLYIICVQLAIWCSRNKSSRYLGRVCLREIRKRFTIQICVKLLCKFCSGYDIDIDIDSENLRIIVLNVLGMN